MVYVEPFIPAAGLVGVLGGRAGCCWEDCGERWEFKDDEPDSLGTDVRGFEGEMFD
jgi:hypothetical protein